MVHYRSILTPRATVVVATVAAILLTFGAGATARASSGVAPVEQGGLLGTIIGDRGNAQQQGTAVPAVPTLQVTVVTPTQAATPVPTVVVTATIPATSPATSPADANIVANPDGIIEGTVVANRSDFVVRFFVEGKTWQLDPQRSAGISLSRPTAVLNLFNCDATSEAQNDCFWDPYLLERDGFFEIVPGAEENAQVGIVLRTAGAPPTNQIWIQNRSGNEEQIYFGAQMVDLLPAAVQEFNIDPATPSVFYLRTCVDGADAPVCEWTARDALPGTYYALTSESWQSGLPGVTVTDMQLSPVLGAEVAAAAATPVPAATSDTASTASAEGAAPAAAEVAPAAASTSGLVCRLAVPTLNVRSGPGLEFAVISKIMTTGETPATVTVVGRTEAGDWLQVDDRQANGGWIINGDAYITCDASTLTLASVPVGLLPATPTPDPAAVAAAPVGSGDASVPGEVPAEGATDGSTDGTSGEMPATEAPVASGSEVPAGLALIVVTNSFVDQAVRFTLDQRYRVAEGPSEVDLAPGQSTSFIVYPGVVAFSASTPWRGLSGNAEVLLEGDKSRTLYLLWVPDPGEEGKWVFQY